ncbi:hypothetical protein Y032_0271g907 [Ancylostoma ceylanicum]|uniref:Neurotransmitter-gated ion-channel ligand-binding domain-containing protein n=1 Tax=Ancylostoma ceylanicum TaxID=53326 RepID=A0A016S9C2_9BILA|nr:hypothetical protein Y032_0271g907 [Ancylostoma ceylanicum]
MRYSLMNHPAWVMVSFLAELLASYGLGKSHEHCANDTDIINTLLKDSYNKHYIPSHPTQVRVDMWVQEVTAVSELTQDFEIGDFSRFVLFNFFFSQQGKVVRSFFAAQLTSSEVLFIPILVLLFLH